jgi:hypothetical protein
MLCRCRQEGLASGLISGLVTGDETGFVDGAVELVLLLHAPTNSAAARINKASNDFMGGASSALVG